MWTGKRLLFKFIRKNVPYSCCSVDEGCLVGYSLAFLSTEQDKIWIACCSRFPFIARFLAGSISLFA